MTGSDNDFKRETVCRENQNKVGNKLKMVSEYTTAAVKMILYISNKKQQRNKKKKIWMCSK